MVKEKCHMYIFPMTTISMFKTNTIFLLPFNDVIKPLKAQAACTLGRFANSTPIHHWEGGELKSDRICNFVDMRMLRVGIYPNG